ncbi:MAG: glycosyltransferase family 2 protein [Candidatus Shapirobacteria bacterium]|nr:glycosyltransferase family 2 protein [Candidatus Shapirobacteria bacterium]MDD4410504.1 glycosyltransferase family 2 protein [Candidatus Shapirobacteria bacterium]
MKIFIIVPVYNEENRAIETINEILQTDGKLNVIVVDDGSSDNSLKILKKKFNDNKKVTVLNHIINLGKGAAMKTGLKMAWKLGGEAVIFVDADGQHNPKYLPKFIEELDKNPIVFGYRELDKKSPWIRRNGNRFAGWLIEILFNIKRKDLLCGFLGFRKEVYKKIIWKSTRYGIETEMAAKVGRSKIPFSEVKIDTIYIDKYKGVTIFDAFKILFKIPFWYVSK